MYQVFTADSLIKKDTEKIISLLEELNLKIDSLILSNLTVSGEIAQLPEGSNLTLDVRITPGGS